MNLSVLIQLLELGRAVLTAGKIHPALPTIHDVGCGERFLLKTDTPVEHAGFGLFYAKVNGENINFNGGGAMSSTADFAWTVLDASDQQLTKMSYNITHILSQLKEAQNELEAGKK